MSITKSIDNYIDQESSFEKLNLREDILKGVYLYGFNKPSAIQIKGIMAINSKKDCLLQSQSGTGKTATYLLGLLNSIKKNNSCQAIVITPTRELAEQVYNVATQLNKYTPFTIALCIGGTSIKESIICLKNCNIIIGTMGRINHMRELGKIKLNHVHLVIVDEADDVLSIEYSDTIINFLALLQNKSQICLISATMPKRVCSVADQLLNNPIKILLKKNEIAVDVILQFYIDVNIEDYKFETLLDLYTTISTSQTIIFCNTIRKVTWLNDKLLENNFSITTVHGKMDQKERNNIVDDFRKGKTRLLLTTDLLARGIDIPSVSLVINYDLPSARETYIHRIGRSGRFGKKGVSITFVKMEDHMDVKNFDKMKHYYNMDIKELPENISDYLS